MSDVTYVWVMSHTNESCHIWMSHVAHEGVMSHMSQLQRLMQYEWVMSQIWVRHVTHIHESCHIWMSHVTHMNESCQIGKSHITYEWVMSHMYESVTHEWVTLHVIESRYMLRIIRRARRGGGRWIISHIRMSHGTYEWVMSHIWRSHVAHEWVMSNV